MNYKLRPGYAFFFGEENPADSSEPEYEQIVVSESDAKISSFQTLREIDGSPCAIFRDKHGQYWAQTEVLARAK